jgi:broad specificity phosphatase PhoE
LIISEFKNKYVIMRHGESEANVAGLIISDPAIGRERYGLTEQGRQQVVASVNDYKLTNLSSRQGIVNPISKVVCSDFLRTIQTATLSTKIMGLPHPQFETGLRERFFGDWEGKTDTHYPDIWKLDKDAASQTAQKIETVNQVRLRGLKVIERLEQQFQNEVILLVSHGDMLQILLTAFVGVTADQHRTLPHHHQAEIKPLIVK